MKRTGIILVLLSGLLAGCGTVHEERMDYATASAKPGYGYITMDFRQGKELGYGKFQFYGVFNSPGKTDYTIMYTKKDNALFVDVTDAPFTDKILNAYIPYYKGYTFRNVSRRFFLEPCATCHNRPRNYSVEVYAVQTEKQLMCPEAEYKNEQTFNYDEVCPGDTWDKRGAIRLKDILGDVFITPHFDTRASATFTHRNVPTEW